MEKFSLIGWAKGLVAPRAEHNQQSEAAFPTNGSTTAHKSNTIMTISYDGEKNPGELGVIKKYIPNYRAIRNRAWQAYLESDVVQSIVQKMNSWVAGRGLKLEAIPMREILEDAGVNLEEDFEKKVQRRWRLFTKSKLSVYGNQFSLNKKSVSAHLNSFVGGDFLVILHVINGRVQVQCIDGEHIFTPVLSAEASAAKDRGNEIRSGVEITPSGEHVAYYVYTSDKKHKRIPAKSETGMRVAYMVYSNLEFRYDSVRGISEIAAVLESSKKLDRYKEAAVGGAEERAKIAYFFEHDVEGTGANPLSAQVRSSLPLNSRIDGASDTPVDGSVKAAAKIAATTGKQTFNLPNGATIKAPTSDMELNFKEFFMTNLQTLCAAVDIPIEVALSKFENNFSSSRAALKMFEQTVTWKRDDWADQFWQPIYNLWLLLEDARGQINAPGLFSAAIQEDELIFEAYTCMKMVGAKVPHVDPVKEAKAVREKLGALGTNVPLITIQQAIEELGGAVDFESILTIFKEQIEEVREISPEPENVPRETSEEEGTEGSLSVAN